MNEGTWGQGQYRQGPSGTGPDTAILPVILHSIWRSGEAFRWSEQPPRG
jgi:hypothetical protein